MSVKALPLQKLFALGTILLSVVWFTPFLVAYTKPVFYQANTLPNLDLLSGGEADASVDYFNYPGLGIAAPIILASDVDPLAYVDWSKIREALYQGVSVTFEGNRIDTAPLLYVIGHSSDYYPHTYAYVFAGLGQAKADETFVLTVDSVAYTYTVVDKKVLDPRDEPSFRQLTPKEKNKQRAVLVTCWPFFTTQKRLVIIGERDAPSTEPSLTQ